MSFNEIIFKISAKIYHIMPFIFFANYKCSFVFSFVALKYTHSINITETYPIIKEGSQVGSYFLFLSLLPFCYMPMYYFLNVVVLNLHYIKH